MNFYKRHIGDYLRDAGHLSLLEHGVYTRLLDVYYTREDAIPADQAARLIGARTREERQAVETVLSEFFELAGDAWRQPRCEREIAAASAKAERNREVGKKGGRPRKMKTQTVSKEGESTEPTENPDGFQTEPRNNPSQTPDTRHQIPKPSQTLPESSADVANPFAEEPWQGEQHDPPTPTPAGQACLLMRAAGLPVVNPSDPRLLHLLEQGVTPQQLGDLTTELREEQGACRSQAYVLKAMENRMARAAAMAQYPPGTAQRAGKRPGTAYGDEIDRISAAIDRARGAATDPETIDVEARHVG